MIETLVTGQTMGLTEQATEIAMQAVSDSSQSDLRALSAGDKNLRMLDCLDALTRLLDKNLDHEALLRFAAQATYRASVYETATLAYEDSVDNFLTALDESPTRGRSKARIIKDAQQKLLRRGHPLISELVSGAQATVASLKASDSGHKGKSAQRQVHEFAITRYKSRTWKRTSDAKRALWPAVKKEALRLGWTISDDQGPITLYGWLLAYNKTTLSTS